MKDLKKDICNLLKETDDSLKIILSPIKDGTISTYKKKSTGNKYADKEIHQWNNRDFSLYLYDKLDKLSIPLNFKKVLYTTLHIPELTSLLKDANGYCDSLFLKNYIDYLFNNYKDNVIGSLIESDGRYVVNPKSLFNENFALSFIESYNHKNFSLDTKKNIYTDIIKSYELGVVRFILDFGIIIPINYVKSLDNIDVNLYSKEIIKELIKAKEPILNRILLKTEEMSPYPKGFSFQNYNKILEIVSKKRKVDLELKNILFTENLNFLEESNTKYE